MSKSITPNQREIIAVRDELTANPFYVEGDSNTGSINVNVTGSGGAVSNNITDIAGNPVQTASSGIMKVGLTDGTGNAITSTGGALDVNATFSGTVTSSPTFSQNPGNPTPTAAYGLIDSSFRPQVSVATALPAGTNVIGHVITDTGSTTAVTGTVTVSGSVTANAGTNLNTSALALAATQTDKSQFTKLTDGTDTALITASGEQNVIATAQPGVDIGDVTVNNAAGASAVNIQDGGNSITVDGTVSITANSSVNVAQLAGTTTDTNSGNKSAGTLRVILATDQPQLTNKLLVTPDANSAINVAQVNGATTLAGNGASGTGAQRVTIASDSTGQIAPAANAAATGTSIYNNTALSSTKQAVNASAGNLYGYHIYNPNAGVVYVQLFNVASGSVTVGSTAPTAVIAVPGLGWADATPATPITFGTALTIAATTTSTGSGTPGTALLANFWYK